MRFGSLALVAVLLVACGGGGGSPTPAPPSTNSAPVVSAANYSTSDIGTVSGTIDASDSDGDSLAFSVSSSPSKGTITSLDAATGDFVYTPADGEDGFDSFEVVASDAVDSSAPATISVEIFGWAGTQQLGSSALDGIGLNSYMINTDGSHLHGGLTLGQIESTPNAGGADNFLRRTDRRGNQTELRQFGGSGENSVRGILQRPQGDGYYVLAQPQGVNIYRFDNSGAEIFAVPLPISGGVSIQVPADWTAIDDSGDLFIVSRLRHQDPGGTNSGLVSKVSGVDGSLVWQREMVTSLDDPVSFFLPNTNRISARGIDIDTEGNAIISGEFWDNSGVRACSKCAFLAKIRGDTGEVLWLREPTPFATCGSTGDGVFLRATVAQDNSIYLNGTDNPTGRGGANGFVSKYSTDGTQELWQYCDDSGTNSTRYFTKLLITADGEIINFGSEMDAIADPAADLVINKFDADGNVLWLRRIGGTKSDGTAAIMHAHTIIEDDQGVLYITGSTDGEMTSAANAGDLDILVMRLDSDGFER